MPQNVARQVAAESSRATSSLCSCVCVCVCVCVWPQMRETLFRRKPLQSGSTNISYGSVCILCHGNQFVQILFFLLIFRQLHSILIVFAVLVFVLAEVYVDLSLFLFNSLL